MKKENKNILLGLKPKWKIVTESGELVEKFRTNSSARGMVNFYQRRYIERLKVVEDLDG